jgi:hydroxymethylpyrimidine/phosphomethylpyrimidine kinase
VPIVTALTIQDTHNVLGFTSVDTNIIEQQANAIINDMPISAIKIGMLGNIENVKIISEFLKSHPDVPVVLDPVLAAGGGKSLATQVLTDAICELLLPFVTVVTPNTQEARALSNLNTDQNELWTKKILAYGCQSVLITGTHANTDNVINTLFIKDAEPILFECERLPHHYHGSGCTLASSLAAFIAKGFSLQTATEKALHYTYQTLQSAQALGGGQLIPNRFFQSGK